MRWTEELNALLNQCVFECGYDFTSAAALLQTRAKQLRLVSPSDASLAVTSDECQVQWMAINPVVEDDEYGDGGHEDDGDDDDLYLRRSLVAHDDEDPDSGSLTMVQEEIRPAATTVNGSETHADEAARSTVAVPDGCPKLELSLTDDDLDALLNTLPSDSDPSHAADSKQHDASASEMQWVLSFLTDPDGIAHRDVEAKNLLCDHADRSDDDNYQYFLHELDQANLLSPQKPELVVDGGDPINTATLQQLQQRGEDATSSEGEGSSGADSDDDWRRTRTQLKRPTMTATHKRRPLPRSDVSDVVLPPAPPLRFPPRSTVVHEAPETDADEEDGDFDPDDNGLDALPPFVPTVQSPLYPPRLPPSPATTVRHINDTKLLALSHKIGQQLRKTGEFTFPKQLFRHGELGVEQEQDPQDEPQP